MKTIGIIAAMDSEAALIKDKMQLAVAKSAVGAVFHIGSLNGKSVVLVKSGVGKVNAAVCAQALIDLFAVDCVINTGVAGAIHKDLKIGDIVISTEAVQHDFDCTALGYPVGEIPWMDKSIFAADESLLDIAKKAAEELSAETGCGVYAARIASGDMFVAGRDKKHQIWKTVSAYCAEMEGAAIAQACTLNKVPFIIIRSISDNADDSGPSDFDSFMRKAAKISQELAERIVDSL